MQLHQNTRSQLTSIQAPDAVRSMQFWLWCRSMGHYWKFTAIFDSFCDLCRSYQLYYICSILILYLPILNMQYLHTHKINDISSKGFYFNLIKYSKFNFNLHINISIIVINCRIESNHKICKHSPYNNLNTSKFWAAIQLRREWQCWDQFKDKRDKP